METFEAFIEAIHNPEYKKWVADVLDHVAKTFPQLNKRIAWNQPMFTEHGTFIIGFSVSKKHLAFSPEPAGIKHFAERMDKEGVTYTTMIIRMPWEKPFDYALLDDIIRYNIEDKESCTTFWRAEK